MTPDKRPSPHIDQRWYTTAFGPLYPIVYAHRTPEAARPEAEFAVRTLGVSGRDRALDLCCGAGRHMATTREHCEMVVGLDYSPELIRMARRQLGRGVPLLRGDMRHVPFRDCFDVLFSFFTSFGYFPEETENRASAAAMASALRPGGRFFLDHMNSEYVRANLVSRSERTTEGHAISEHRWIDEETRRVNKTTEVYRGPKMLLRNSESVRLYEFGEIRALLAEVGLAITTVFGNYDGAPFSSAHPRMILVGTKEA